MIFVIQVTVKFSLSVTDRKTFRCVFLLLLLNTCTCYVCTHNELYEVYFLKDTFLVFSFSLLIWCSKFRLTATKKALLLFVVLFGFSFFLVKEKERDVGWFYKYCIEKNKEKKSSNILL